MLPPQGWYGTDCSRPTKKAASKASQEPPALGEHRRCSGHSAAPLPPPLNPSLSGRATAEAQPHLREVLVLPPALHTPSQARKRPLIYVYDLEPMFNTRILQYRMGKCVAQLGGSGAEQAAGCPSRMLLVSSASCGCRRASCTARPAAPRRTLCTWRHWQSENASSTNEWMYGVEQLMHEQLLQSPHRWALASGRWLAQHCCRAVLASS